MRVEIQKPRENRDFTARGALARRISTRLKSLISHPSIREASFLAGFRACPPRERLPFFLQFLSQPPYKVLVSGQKRGDRDDEPHSRWLCSSYSLGCWRPARVP